MHSKGAAPLINDDHRNPNLKVSIQEIDGKLIPVFRARKYIPPYTELAYNYGPNKPEYWWRKLLTSRKIN